MVNKLIKFSLAALLFGCASPREVNHPEREVITVSIGYSGYTVSQDDIQYRLLNDSDYGCSLFLGGDAELYDYDCNGVVDNFYDNQGRHSCDDNPDDRCYLATRIFQQKKEMLRVNEIHQIWLEYMSSDVLSSYLD